MKMSRRARRMARHHRKQKHVSALNLVSLMDIFTILVFFLLVSSAPSSHLPSTKEISIPASTATTPPDITPVILLSAKQIMLQGQVISSVEAALMDQGRRSIPALTGALAKLNTASSDDSRRKKERPVTIMGDKDTPYALLKRILSSCSEAGFNRVDMVVSSQRTT